MVAPKSKIHFLKNLDLATILEPAGPAKSISGTKGEVASYFDMRRSVNKQLLSFFTPCLLKLQK